MWIETEKHGELKGIKPKTLLSHILLELLGK